MSRNQNVIMFVKANRTFFKSFLHKGKYLMIFYFLLFGISFPVKYIGMYAPKKFIDEIVINGNLKSALFFIGIMIVSQAVHMGLTGLFNNYRNYICSACKVCSKKLFFQSLTLLPYIYFEDSETKNRITRANSHSDTGGASFVHLCFSLLDAISSVLTVSYISVNFSIIIWLVMITTFLLRSALIKIIKKLEYNFMCEQTMPRRLSSYFNNLFLNKETVADIKINDATDFFGEKYSKITGENINAQFNHDKKIQLCSSLEITVDKLCNFAMYVVIGIRLYKGKATVGDYTMFFAMISQVNGIFATIKNNAISLYNLILSSQDYNDIVCNAFNKRIKECSKIEVANICSIEFQNVSYRYPTQKRYALVNVSFKINRGEKILLVGENGCGKSTLIKLLLNFYAPTSGEVCVNGTNMKHINAIDYLKHCCVHFQDHMEYAINIRENVSFGNSKDSDEKLYNVLEEVELYKTIQQYPSGIDSLLMRNYNAEGIELSGGERQKLSLAKAMFNSGDLYVFDEPTSALDPISSDIVFNMINNLPGNPMVIVISHDLKFASRMDRILFLKDGKLIADGKHSTIVEDCLEYKELYDSFKESDINEYQ